MAREVHQTQWAGQFGVAHEMTRRGYLVTFTMGNAPTADLLCKSPNGVEFSVQVKSLKSKNYFLYQESLLHTNSHLFFVFVLVPTTIGYSNLKPPEYFILDKQQFSKAVAEETDRAIEVEKKRGRPFAKFSSGINYRTINKGEYRNAWQNLPA